MVFQVLIFSLMKLTIKGQLFKFADTYIIVIPVCGTLSKAFFIVCTGNRFFLFVLHSSQIIYLLREAARVFRESKISNEKSNFFLFYQNIPFCELVSKKIF